MGTVEDTSGAVVPNANVTVKSQETQNVLQVTSSSVGEFTFNQLQPGHYSVTVTAPGFKTFVLPSVLIAAGDHIRINAKLELGQLSETVEVTGAANPILHTDDSTLSTSIPAAAVQDLPLNGRNFVQLAQLAAGANEGPPQSISAGARPDDRRQTSSVSANGQSDSINEELIDGMDNNERIIGTIGVRPSIDAIQEFRVQTNLYTAEVGRTAGAVINVITKSGSNQFHGSLYEFLRNDIFDGRDFFATTGSAPEYRQNQFGGSLGGPIQRDKTFFFGDYEGMRIVQGTTQVSTVPTLYEEQHPGDFSDIGGPVLTSAQISPIALNYFALYPAPNLGGTSNNFVISPKRTQFSHTADVRIDHYFPNKDLLYGRYTYNNVATFTPGALPAVTLQGIGVVQPNGYLNGFAGTAPQKAQNIQLNYVHLFGQSLVMNLRAGYTRINNASYPLNYGKELDNAFGIVNGNLGDARTSGLTPMSPSGYAQLGDSTFVPLQYLDNTYQYNGDIIYAKGAHNIRIGAGVIRRQALEAQNPYGLGYYTFQANPTGNALASFLSGSAFTVQRTNVLQVPSYRLWEPSVYFQDDWRVRSWLTLNIGLRYDVFTPPVEVHNHTANFNPATATLMIPGVNGIGPTTGVATDYSNLAPRFGFAATMRPGTVLRGGFGISFWPDNIGFPFGYNNAPFVFTYAPNNLTVDLSTPLPKPVASDPNNLSGVLSGYSRGFSSSYIEQFNLNIQQQVGANVLTIGYVGELGRHLNINPNINLAPPGTGAIQPRRPFNSALPNVTSINVRNSSGYSNYNALQATFERRLAHGLAISSNYNWEHGINDVISYSLNQFGEGFGADPRNIATLERATSDQNVNTRVVAQITYEFPNRQGGIPIMRFLTNGWQTNIIEVWQTGQPFTIVNASPRSNTGVGGNGDRPDQVGNPYIANRSIHKFFNTAAFAPQALGTIGTSRRDNLYGPHFRHLDVSLFKEFPIWERVQGQFRVETFNLTNTPNFATPVAALGNANFGTINSTRPGSSPREIQFAMKFLF